MFASEAKLGSQESVQDMCVPLTVMKNGQGHETTQDEVNERDTFALSLSVCSVSSPQSFTTMMGGEAIVN